MSWVEAASDFSFDGKRVRCKTKPTQDTKFNCLWKDGAGATKGEHYWEVKMIAGDGIWFGITNEASFGPGYKNRGMLYGGGGTVSDGGAALVSNYGPKVAAGDTVGCLCEFKTSSNLVITYYHNGKCLGPAFDLKNDSWPPLFPIIGCKRQGDEAQINDKVAPPSTRSRDKPEGNKGIFGKWHSTEYQCTLETMGEPSSLKIIARVINTLQGSAVHEGGDKYKSSGRVASTMMAGPPDMMEKEKDISKVIEGLTELKADPQSKELTVGGDGKQLVFQPLQEEPPKPFTDLSRLRLTGL